jgi:probable addiction module antidote protein
LLKRKSFGENMPKTRPFRDVLLDSLSNPEVAAAYLTEAYAESPAMFCKALRNVAQSRQMASVARQAGVTRESLYRATSDIGNPTLDTLASVLDVLGLGVEVYSRQAKAAPASPPIAISRVVGGTHRIAAKRANPRRRIDDVLGGAQMAFNFDPAAREAIERSFEPQQPTAMVVNAVNGNALPAYLSSMLLERNHGYSGAINNDQ